MLLALLLIWFDIVQIFSLGLSLPTDTGRGLSEHGDASRDTDSESSSLNGFPGIEYDENRYRFVGNLAWLCSIKISLKYPL